MIKVGVATGVHPKTAGRRVKESGLKCFRAASRVRLTDAHRENRIQFCQNMLNLRDEGLLDFNNIVFTDEKVFCTDVNRRKLVYRPPNSRYVQQYVSETRLSGRISQGFWGWICSGGPGELAKIPGRFNSHQYREILDEIGVPTMETIFGSCANVVFMHDNSRVHTANMIREYISTLGFQRVLPWPAYSPDLNPIERVWAHISREWPMMENRNIPILENLIETRWDELRDHPQFFENLYNGLENRFEYVINHDGYLHP